MKKLSLLITSAMCLSLFAVGLHTFRVSAQTPNAPGVGQALEIAPPVINLTADPGQTITTQISLRDISSSKLIVQGQVNDFVASGEDGAPKILLEDDPTNPYSLKSWIGALPQLTLNPRQIKNLPVTIKVPANAAPGGYFGVVRFTATAPELDSTGVSLSASLGALLLIRVNGDAKEGLSIEEFTINKAGKSGVVFERTPIEFIQRIKNTGNVHVQPAGQVSITDMFGKKIAVVNVNLPPRNVLPGSIRKFNQPLDSSVLGSKQLFGRYTADLRLTYGANNQVVTQSVTFWVVPYKLIIGAIILLVAGFFVLRVVIRRYNQNIIKKAQKNSRRK